MTREYIEKEARAVKKQLYELVVIASKKSICVGKEIMPHVERIVYLRKLWLSSK